MNKKVFIVDDDRIFSTFLKHQLSKYYDITLFNNAHDALDAIEKEQPDIVTIDYHMPNIDGKQLYLIIKEMFPSIKSIVISMEEEGKLVSEMITLGVKDYVIKDEHVIKGILYAIEGDGELFQDYLKEEEK